MSVWFGYRALPDGSAIAEGSYLDVEAAMNAREKMKAIDMEVSPWFHAEDKLEADKMAKWYLEGGPNPRTQKG